MNISCSPISVAISLAIGGLCAIAGCSADPEDAEPREVRVEPLRSVVPDDSQQERLTRIDRVLTEAEQRCERAHQLVSDTPACEDAIDQIVRWSKLRDAVDDLRREMNQVQDLDEAKGLYDRLVAARTQLPENGSELEPVLLAERDARQLAAEELSTSESLWQEAEALLRQVGNKPAIYPLRSRADTCGDRIRVTRDEIGSRKDPVAMLQIVQDLNTWQVGLEDRARQIEEMFRQSSPGKSDSLIMDRFFVMLPDEVSLSPPPPAGQESAPATLGKVAVPDPAEFELELSGDVLGDAGVFRIGPSDASTSSQSKGSTRCWPVVLDVGGGFPSVPVAQLVLENETLAFRWESNPPDTASELRNCRLRIAIGPYRKSIPLRKPIKRLVTVKPSLPELWITKIDISDYPRAGTVHVEWSFPDLDAASRMAVLPLTPIEHGRIPGAHEARVFSSDERIVSRGGLDTESLQDGSTEWVEFIAWAGNHIKLIDVPDLGPYYLLVRFYQCRTAGADLHQRQLRIGAYLVGGHPGHEQPVAVAELRTRMRNWVEATTVSVRRSIRECEENLRSQQGHLERVADGWSKYLRDVETKLRDDEIDEITAQLEEFRSSGDLDDLPPKPRGEAAHWVQIERHRRNMDRIKTQLQSLEKQFAENTKLVGEMDPLLETLDDLDSGYRMTGRLFVVYPPTREAEQGSQETDGHEVDLVEFVGVGKKPKSKKPAPPKSKFPVKKPQRKP